MTFYTLYFEMTLRFLNVYTSSSGLLAAIALSKLRLRLFSPFDTEFSEDPIDVETEIESNLSTKESIKISP